MLGSFAAWGGAFSTIDCGLTKVRGKEDALNPIIAGFGTGCVLAIRSGAFTALKNGLIGGAILAIIEASGFLIYTVQLKRQQAMMEEMQRRMKEEQKEQKAAPKGKTNVTRSENISNE